MNIDRSFFGLRLYIIRSSSIWLEIIPIVNQSIVSNIIKYYSILLFVMIVRSLNPEYAISECQQYFSWNISTLYFLFHLDVAYGLYEKCSEQQTEDTFGDIIAIELFESDECVSVNQRRKEKLAIFPFSDFVLNVVYCDSDIEELKKCSWKCAFFRFKRVYQFNAHINIALLAMDCMCMYFFFFLHISSSS